MDLMVSPSFPFSHCGPCSQVFPCGHGIPFITRAAPSALG
nr:MAG TPA: Thioredoxin-like domain [Caudoviricetes sp.]DAX75093.1 MAG TPA: Thioredoxin-like domain [Caudoviricetes sp.]